MCLRTGPGEDGTNLLLIAVNHRTATLDDREALAFEPSEALTVLRSLRGCSRRRSDSTGGCKRCV